MKLMRPAWIEIDLDKLVHNMNSIRNMIADRTKILSVIKADAYSLGASEIATTFSALGIRNFAVASGNEALALRRDHPDIEILVLGYTPEDLYDEMIENHIDMALYRVDVAERLNELAKISGTKAGVHIAIDSGMNRIGFKPTEESIDLIEAICKMKGIEVKGMFTHFAKADDDPEFTETQYERFEFVVEGLAARGIRLPRHVSNSHAILKERKYDLEYVRPGIIQYGTAEGDPAAEAYDFRFVASVKARIGHVKTVGAGEGVSYGQIYVTEKETKIATLPIGYADGIERSLSQKIDVLVSGKRCPQIGKICMDQMMVDVTGVDCKIGDEVVLLGKQGDEEITIEEIAAANNEIPTSFLTHFKMRLPRVYLRDGKIVHIIDQVLGTRD